MKTNKWMISMEALLLKYNFSAGVVDQLRKYFTMLSDNKATFSIDRMEAQIDLLLPFTDDKREEIIRRTREHGWKSLRYVAEQVHGENLTAKNIGTSIAVNKEEFKNEESILW